MNNISLPELKAFKRAPCLGLSQWENGNLTTNRAQLVLVRTQVNPVPVWACQIQVSRYESI